VVSIVSWTLTGGMIFLYKLEVGRPRTRNVAMVNGRITVEQMEWLEARAEKLGGNLSAALRQSLTDAMLLEMARGDYRNLLQEQPEFSIPRHPPPRDTTRLVETVLAFPLQDTEALAMRHEESGSDA